MQQMGHRQVQNPQRYMMVGVYWGGSNGKYATNRPQIGKVVDITNEDVVIHQYDAVQINHSGNQVKELTVIIRLPG